MKQSIITTLLLVIFSCCLSQHYIPLWPVGKMPNTKGIQVQDSTVNERAVQVATPHMYAFFPSKDDNSGAAVLIFPGGGYHHLTYNLGGFQLAKWFNTLGISAFVVMHRLPTSPDLQQREIAPLQDVERAMRMVQANADKWSIQKDKIGVMGTSAGGHVAAMIGTDTMPLTYVHDSIDAQPAKPAFMILISPVIDLGKYAHKGSRDNLLGLNASQQMIEKYSMQNRVTDKTPPCFLVHAFNDKSVPPQNSLLFYQALLEHNVSASYHVFPQGGHAIGIHSNLGSTELWKDLCEAWLKEMKFLK